jgi:hypothetical protein
MGLADGEDGDAKLPVPATTHAGGVRLVALVELAFGPAPEPRLTRSTAVDAVASILPQILRLVVDEPALQRSELEALADLVDVVPVYRLERPRRIELLETTSHRVRELLVSPSVPMQGRP